MSSSAYTPPSYTPPAQYKSWFARNWKWFMPLLAFTALGTLCLFVVGVYEIAANMVRSSDVYSIAIQKAQQSPAVWSNIGRPFQVGKFVQGNIGLSNDNGEAELSIPISGAQGAGHIVVSAKKRAGQWTFQTLEVHVDADGTVIPLLGPGGEAAPADDSV